MTLSEKSDNLIRCCFAFMGCRGCRPLQLKVYHEGEEKGIVDKPCKCGGCFCCPLEMTLHDNAGNMVGHVRENFSPYCGKCFQCCCKGSYYHNASLIGTSSMQIFPCISHNLHCVLNAHVFTGLYPFCRQ